MKISFYSNYLNHHQLPFSTALNENNEIDYTFVATTPINSSRLKLGYEDMNKKYPFVLTTYDNDSNKQKALELSKKSDVVIIGSAPEEYIKQRIKENKLIFRYSERIFKNGMSNLLNPKFLISFYLNHTKNYNKQMYMLCSSAYTSADFSRLGAYKNKYYKWGYFPELKKYDSIEEIIKRKEECSILWVGRLIDWKHPEIAIKVAKMLKLNGYKFKLNIIGTGELENKLKQMVLDYDLMDCVKLLGSISPEIVREYMEKSQIFLFTSDFNEGWGSVLNESMNSGCAVIASHAIGSVPFLIENNQNGLIFENENIEDLYEKIKIILKDSEYSKKLGKNAYESIVNTWNSEVATKRLLILIDELKKNGKCSVFKEGPCSEAKILKNNWYRGVKYE